MTTHLSIALEGMVQHLQEKEAKAKKLAAHVALGAIAEADILKCVAPGDTFQHHIQEDPPKGLNSGTYILEVRGDRLDVIHYHKEYFNRAKICAEEAAWLFMHLMSEVGETE